MSERTLIDWESIEREYHRSRGRISPAERDELADRIVDILAGDYQSEMGQAHAIIDVVFPR